MGVVFPAVVVGRMGGRMAAFLLVDAPGRRSPGVIFGLVAAGFSNSGMAAVTEWIFPAAARLRRRHTKGGAERIRAVD